MFPDEICLISFPELYRRILCLVKDTKQWPQHRIAIKQHSGRSRPSDKGGGGRVGGGGVLSLLPWIPSPGSATAAILSWHSPFDYTKMSLPPLSPGVTCKGTWEGYKLTQKVISWLLLHSSQGALQDALPLILWNLPQSVFLLPSCVPDA